MSTSNNTSPLLRSYFGYFVRIQYTKNDLPLLVLPLIGHCKLNYKVHGGCYPSLSKRCYACKQTTSYVRCMSIKEDFDQTNCAMMDIVHTCGLLEQLPISSATALSSFCILDCSKVVPFVHCLICTQVLQVTCIT